MKNKGKQKEGEQKENEITIGILRHKIETHDCHLSPDDGCICVRWRQLLRDLTNKRFNK